MAYFVDKYPRPKEFTVSTGSSLASQRGNKRAHAIRYRSRMKETAVSAFCERGAQIGALMAIGVAIALQDAASEHNPHNWITVATDSWSEVFPQLIEEIEASVLWKGQTAAHLFSAGQIAWLEAWDAVASLGSDYPGVLAGEWDISWREALVRELGSRNATLNAVLMGEC